ncbi:hypothetical protein BGW42_000589 [Actinomortierella wolfii]|nr:hypothetical protein BGW42_000589 [Actinomortierella wolfii]
MSYSAIVQSTSFQGNNFRKAASRMAAQVTRTQPQRSHSSSSLLEMQGKHSYYHARLQHHDYEDDMEGHPHWDDVHVYYNSAQQSQHSLASQGLYIPQHHISDYRATNGQQQHLHRQQQQEQQQQQQRQDFHINYDNHSQYPPLSAAHHSSRRDGNKNNSSQYGHRSSASSSSVPSTSTAVDPNVSASMSAPTIVLSTSAEGSATATAATATALGQSALQHTCAPLLPPSPPRAAVSLTSTLTLSNEDKALWQGKTVDGSVETNVEVAVVTNSDPEPFPDVKAEQPTLQTNVHALSHGHPVDTPNRGNASKLTARSQDSQFLSVSEPLHRGIEFDQSSLSSARETSDSDDDRSQGSAMDSFEDQLGHNARRSKKARSLQRLIRKNRMLGSSLLQAQRDLQQERESRKIVDECHLKTKEELLQRLADKDDENERLQQELEEARKQVEELKQRAYRIGYDSGSYSLSGGLTNIGGGLMLHHSSLINGQDDSDEFFVPHSFRSGSCLPSSTSTAPESSEKTTAVTANNSHVGSQAPLIYGTSDDEDEEEHGTSTSARSSVDSRSDSAPSSLPLTNDVHNDRNEEMTPPSSKDENTLIHADTSSLSQDGTTSHSESFELLAKSHLQQAIVAKLTTAMTILQLDDLAMKYDASPQEVLVVLINEMAKWWESARLKAGGPAQGGWGPMTANPNGKGITNVIRETVERDFRQYFGPLLFHYVSNHQDQLLVLKCLEEHSGTSLILRENQPFQLMAMFKSDILDRDAILEWWRLLEEPKRIFGHGQDIRSLTARFIAFLETHMDEDDDEEEDSEDEYDSEDDSDDDSDDLDEEDEEEDGMFSPQPSSKGSVRIIGLDQLKNSKNESEGSKSSPALNGETPQPASSPEMLVIGSEDGEDDRSTTSSLERLEARERERRISFCAHTTVFGEDSSDEDEDEESDEEVDPEEASDNVDESAH